ncbi:MAG: PAS domain S-box protein [Candidatus Bathyarchaeia archaeon]
MKITKRKQKRRRSMKTRPLLRNPDRKYKYLCEDGSAAMLMLDADGKVMDVNNALLEISGYSRDEIVGKNAIDFVVQEQKQKTAAQIQTASTKGTAPQFEVTIRIKNGSTRTLLLPPTQLVLEEGERSFLVMGVDITERKKAEEELAYQARLLENVNDAIVSTDSHLIIRSWNRVAEEMYGWKADEVLGRSSAELLRTEYRGISRAKAIQELVETGQFHRECVQSRKDGTRINADVGTVTLRGGGGEIIGYVSVNRDITERKRMGEALRESEEKYRAMVENLPNMIGIFQGGVLKYVNSAAVLKLGWTYEELVSPSFDPIVNVVSQKSRSLLRENVGKNLRGEDVAPYEISLTKKDGSEVLVSATGAKIIYDQKPAIEFVFDDITELRKLHDELERYSKHLQDSEGKLRALHQHALQLGSANNIEEIMKSTLEAIEFALGFDVADVYLAAGDSLRVAGTRGAPVGLSEERLTGSGLVAKAARNQATVLVSDTTKEPDYVDRKGRDWTGPHTMISELAVPVVVDAETVAVLNAESIRCDAFSLEDQGLLETLASHVGSALGRLRHEEELESVARFPSENPNPVLRLDRYGTVISANEASKALLQDWGSATGQAAPKPWRDAVIDVLSSGESRDIDIELGGRSYTFLVKPIVEGDYVNLYGADTTERKRAEEKLRESEVRYHSLFDRMLDGVYLSTHEGRFVDVNDAFVRMFGYSSKREMLDITDIKKELYFSPEERGRHILDTDQEEVKEYRMRRKDGSEVWVEDHGGYVHGEHGTIIYHEGILRDITQRKRLEEELKRYSLHLEELVIERTGDLKESEARYRSLVENIPLKVFEKDRNSAFISCNESLANDFKIKTEEIVGMTDYDFFSKDLADRYRADDKRVMDLGQTEEIEERYVVSGQEFWVHTTKAPIRDDGGNITGVIGIFRDMTERRLMIQKLRESEERYRGLFDACPVSLWEEDLSAVKQFIDELRQKEVSNFDAYFATHPEDVAKCAGLVKVLNVNKATLDLYNAKSVDEVIGGLSRVLTEEGNRVFVGELVAFAQGEKYYEAETESRTQQGETKCGNLICNVVPGYEQSLAKVLVSVADLTPQKKLEAELVKSQRLAAIGETAAMVGHDLRNPLQGIAGALYLLKQESLTSEERSEMLQIIEKSVHYSDAIVKDLSDYAAEMKLKLAHATPKSISRDAIGAVKVPQNVRVQDLSEDNPTFRVDPDMMRRVFVNLIENAIDAMPQGGTLTINSKKSESDVEIALKDTGSGISERAMENLWKPLQTTKAQGMGFGLAICKRIIDAHGGNISARSEVGRGTTITIHLPLGPVEVKQK